MEQHPIEFRHEQLVDLVLEDVVVPVHAVGHHHKRCAMFHQMPRHQGVLGEAARPVGLAISGRKLGDIEEAGAGRHSLHPLKRRVLAAGHTAVPVALIFGGEKFPQRFAGLAIVLRDGIDSGVDELRVVAPEPHRGMLGAEPAGPVARLERFKFIPARNRIEKDKVWNRRIELPQRLREHAAKRRPREAGPLRIAPLQQRDRLQVLRLRGLHAAHDIEPVGHPGTQRHQA